MKCETSEATQLPSNNQKSEERDFVTLWSRKNHRRTERENPGDLSGPVSKAFTQVSSLYPLCDEGIIILNLPDEEMDSLGGNVSKVTQLANDMGRIGTYLSLKPEPLTTMLQAFHCWILLFGCVGVTQAEMSGKGKGERALSKSIEVYPRKRKQTCLVSAKDLFVLGRSLLFTQLL